MHQLPLERVGFNLLQKIDLFVFIQVFNAYYVKGPYIFQIEMDYQLLVCVTYITSEQILVYYEFVYFVLRYCTFFLQVEVRNGSVFCSGKYAKQNWKNFSP